MYMYILLHHCFHVAEHHFVLALHNDVGMVPEHNMVRVDRKEPYGRGDGERRQNVTHACFKSWKSVS